MQNFPIDARVVYDANGQHLGGVNEQLAQNMSQLTDIAINVKYPPYNAKGDGIADDTSSLNNAFADGIAQGRPVYLPAGTYKTTAQLTANGTNVMIFGAGGNKTMIKPSSNTAYDCLVIGDGIGSGSRPSGFLRDIAIDGTVARPVGSYRAAVKLNAIRQLEVRNIFVDNFEIGFDLINNCYGSYFMGCRTWSGVTLGLNLRTGPQSGNDLQFYNNWFYGNYAAIQVANDCGGFQFWGGQLSAGWNLASPDDTKGVVILGKDYITGTTGGVSHFMLDGFDVEGFQYNWFIRAYDEVQISLRGLGLQPNNSSRYAIGFLKADNAKSSNILIQDLAIKGNWTATNLISLANSSSSMSIQELNTSINAQINGVQTNGSSICTLSQLTTGISLSRLSGNSRLQLGNTIVQDNAGTLQYSTDWGSTWQNLKTFIYPITYSGYPGVMANPNNAYAGSPINVHPDTTNGFNYYRINRIRVEFRNTFGGSESVTAKIQFNYSDGSNTYVEKTATSNQNIWFTDDDVNALIKDGLKITSIYLFAKSNLSSSGVGVNYRLIGEQY